VYYGWVIVATVALCDFVQSQETFPILAVLMKPVTEEFGWTRTQFTTPMAIGTILGGVIGPAVGGLLDRHGTRWPTTAGFALLGVLMPLMGMMNSLWQYYAIQVSARFLTHGVIMLGLTIAVPKWFIVKRGRAVALGSLGNSVGQFIMPPATLLMINLVGWRLTTAAQGIVVALLAVLPAALFLRRQPEDVGLLPDGASRAEWDRRSAGAGPAGGEGGDRVVTVHQALRSPAFYLLTVAGMCSPFSAAALNLHLFSYLTDRGIDQLTAVSVTSLWLLCNALGGFASGFLAERFTSRTVTMVAFGVAAAPVLLLPGVDSAPAAFAFALVQGCATGASLAQRLLWPDYFGRRHLGAIRGMTHPAQNVAIAAGPLFGALVFDLTGGYAQAFLAFGTAMVMACVSVFLARPPRVEAAP
jgi:MFS family permease